MKKPYIKKYAKISKFTIWIVGGFYVRGKIDEEFTNFGQHFRFKFIPENEFWIDKENSGRGEEKFYIEHLLIENYLMSKGKSYDYALKEADKKEKAERLKLKQIKKIENKNNAEIIKKIHKKILKEYSNKVNVFRVNGNLVRSLFNIDFTEGGHDKVYSFVPKNEVWIDDDVSEKELVYVLIHELHERFLMSRKIKYEEAHHKSSILEFSCRHNPKIVKEVLDSEIKKNS